MKGEEYLEDLLKSQNITQEYKQEIFKYINILHQENLVLKEKNETLTLLNNYQLDIIRQLEGNWNKLKEYIISTRYEYGDLDQDLEDYDLTIEDVLNKMLELEKGNDYE